jgi:hypothetical protein
MDVLASTPVGLECGHIVRTAAARGDNPGGLNVTPRVWRVRAGVAPTSLGAASLHYGHSPPASDQVLGSALGAMPLTSSTTSQNGGI